MKLISTLVCAALFAQHTAAHPGQSAEEHAKEVAERNAYLSTHKRSLAHCADTLKARGNDLAMAHRRSAAVRQLRAKRSISQEKSYLRARDLDSVLATSHASNLTGITASTDPSLLFSGNNSCILTPEVTQGPYWVQGELIRQDVTEDQEGVPLHLDIQLIDVNTCEPVPRVYVELWHCNSTGVYSGVVANGNGDTSDTTNLDSTFLRGVAQADASGVVQFDTLFPGHYTGRATHIHVMSHTLEASPNDNNTLAGNSVTHVGQMFFDQDLIELVEAVEPYAGNTQELMQNADDSILGEEAADVDPMVEYVLLGDSVSEGLFGWLAFGIDSGAAYNVTPAATLTEDGGIANENAGAGMGGGAPPSGSGAPPGSAPSGARPSGAAPTGLAVGSTLVSSSVVASSAAPSSIVASSAVSSSVPASSATPSAVDGTQLKTSPGAPQSGKNNDRKPSDKHNQNNKGPQQRPSGPSFPAHA